MNHYIGQLLDDRYEILEVIGTGGTAVVYKALDHRLNRLVAIKILKDEFSGDDEFRRRFRACVPRGHWCRNSPPGLDRLSDGKSLRD